MLKIFAHLPTVDSAIHHIRKNLRSGHAGVSIKAIELARFYECLFRKLLSEFVYIFAIFLQIRRSLDLHDRLDDLSVK